MKIHFSSVFQQYALQLSFFLEIRIVLYFYLLHFSENALKRHRSGNHPFVMSQKAG